MSFIAGILIDTTYLILKKSSSSWGVLGSNKGGGTLKISGSDVDFSVWSWVLESLWTAYLAFILSEVFYVLLFF